jgi:hypothetical protein
MQHQLHHQALSAMLVGPVAPPGRPTRSRAAATEHGPKARSAYPICEYTTARPTEVKAVSEHAMELAARRGVPPWAVALVFEMHDGIRSEVRKQLATAKASELSAVAHVGAGDVSYGIDVPAEGLVREVASRAPEPILVVAEGIGTQVFPAGAHAEDARFCLIVDPVDGSRELMYQKRSAFILSGLAPVGVGLPDLSSVVLGVVTELPPSASSRAVQAWAVRGEGAYEQLWDLDSAVPRGEQAKRQPFEAGLPASSTTSPGHTRPWGP